MNENIEIKKSVEQKESPRISDYRVNYVKEIKKFRGSIV